MIRPAATLTAAALIAAAVSGCQTTQEQSARIARGLGHQSARTGTTRIGSENRAVRVVKAVVVAGSPAAVAIELTNSGAEPQAKVPVLVTVRDAKGTVVYRNDTKGIDPSIQELALLGPHATAWWVDNQVLANAAGGVPVAVRARVGTGAAAAPGAPDALSVSAVRASNSFPGPHVDVTVRNGGAATQAQIAVYAVAIAGGRVVGAGRAIVASLAAGTDAPAEIPMTGTATGAAISVSAVSGSG
jgi:hypothetical protein